MVGLFCNCVLDEMIADSFFTQGAGHSICQDHATTRETERFTFAVISDGCSASPKSEVGASILSHAFMQAYITTWEWADDNGGMEVFETVLLANLRNKLLEIKRHTGLENGAFDATIVAAIADKQEERMNFSVWGDGIIQVKRKQSLDEVHQFNYPSNAPYYFSYTLDSRREEDYTQAFGNPNANVITYYQPRTSGLGGDEHKSTPPYYNWSLPLEDIEAVSVFSDGIETFSKTENGLTTPIHYLSIISELTNYKSKVGEFVRRRMSRFLKESKHNNISHFDDISSASIIVSE